MRASIANLAAVVVALICWAGLAIQFNATYAAQRDVVATVWVLLRFFTVITNLAVAIVMTRVALGGKVSAFMLAGVTIAIILVGLLTDCLAADRR